MRLSVAEVISSGHLSELKIEAGLKGLHNVVERFSILRIWQKQMNVRNGDLVLLDFPNTKVDSSPYLGCVSDVAKLNAAALIIQEHLVTHELKQQADRHKLPLLSVKNDELWRRIISNAERDLLIIQIEIYERVRQIHNELSLIAVRGQGVEEITRVLAKLINNPVVVEDHRFQVLAWDNGSAQPDPVRMRVIEERKVPTYVLEILAYHGVLKRLGTEHKPFRVPPIEQLSMQARVMAPIRVGEIRYGHLSISESNRPLGELDLMAVEQAATLIALQFSMQQIFKERKERLAEEIVYDLIFSRDLADIAINQRLKFLGYTLGARYAVVIVDIVNFSSIVEHQKWDEIKIQQAKDNLKYQIRSSIKGKSALIASGGDAFIILFPLGDRDTLETLRGFGHRIQRLILEILPSQECSIGVGRVCSQLSDLSQSYNDAQMVLQLQKNTKGIGSIVVYDELGIYRLLANCSDENLLNSYMQNCIGKLIMYDDMRNAQLLKTLRVYLRNRCNKSKTATELLVHLNTVKYRLKKICELLRVDFENSEDVLNLHIGVKIADLLGIYSQLGNRESE
jgi:purine catabolism regulator